MNDILFKSLQRLCNRIAITNNDNECWLYTGSKTHNGYGNVKLWDGTKQIYYRAHRLVYEIVHSIKLGDVVVMHTCDVRACCNPNHLVVGTQKDNVHDALKKGRLKGFVKK